MYVREMTGVLSGTMKDTSRAPSLFSKHSTLYTDQDLTRNQSRRTRVRNRLYASDNLPLGNIRRKINCNISCTIR